MRLRALSLLSAVTLLALPAYAGVQPLQRTAAGHLATEVVLQGQAKVLFNVDTGAGASAVYETLRKRLELAPERGARIQMHGAAGAQMIERYRLPLLSVAGVETRDLLVSGLPAGISHGEDVMGIVGRDVLSRYVVEFDLVADTLGLHPPGVLPESAHGWELVPFRVRPQVGLVELMVEIGGAPVKAVLDTGARKSFVNWQAAGAGGVSAESPQVRRGAGASGATAHAIGFHISPFPDVRVGAARFSQPSLAIADLPVFQVLGMDRAPAMIVGLDLLDGRRFVLDYPGGRLLIERDHAAMDATGLVPPQRTLPSRD